MEQFAEKKARYTAEIRKRLSDYRYIHSLNVAKSAVYLAKKYGADIQQAEIAGILHDIMKDTDAKEQLKILKESGIIDFVVLQNRKLYHAYTGALFAEKQLGERDAAVLNAIRFHTTGRENMSLLEKILYVADFISADRNYNGVERMRECAEKSLDLALTEGLSYTIYDLVQQGVPVHEDTVRAYNWMVSHGGKDDQTPRFVVRDNG